MNKIVLFLCDFISTDSVKAVEKRFNNSESDVCFYRKDNSKLETQSDHLKFCFLIGDRHFDYLAWVLEQIEVLHEKANVTWLKNLINIARYEIYEKHTERLYKLWAIEILSAKHPSSEFFIIEHGGRVDGGFQKKMFNNTVIYLQSTPSKVSTVEIGIRHFIVKLARIILYPIKWVNHEKQYEVLFIENYLNSAKISLSLQKSLTAKGLKTRILALNEKVWKVAQEAENSIRIQHSISKVTQLFAWLVEFFVFYITPLFMRQCRNSSSIFKYLIDGNFYHSIARAAWYRVIFRPIFKHHQPKIALSTSMASLPIRAMMMNCNEKRIETGFLQHGLHAPSGLGLNKDWMLQNHIFLWGRHDQNIFANAGYKDTRLHLIGSNKVNPQFEKPKSDKAQKGTDICILYLPQRTGGAALTKFEGREMLEWFAYACSMLPHVKGQVKFHPGDVNMDIASISPIIEISPPQVSVATLLQNADVVISGFSTTAGLEACALGKPLIILVTENREPVIEYEKYGAALIAQSKIDLLKKLEAISNDPALVQSLREGCERLLQNYFEFTGQISIDSFVQKVQIIIHESKAE